MPILDSYERLPLDFILVDREGRQRREIETSDLEPSIRLRGVVTPIIVERTEAGGRQVRLVCGERRLAASKALGLPDIPVRFVEDLSQTEIQIIELEENVKRQDLPWQDQLSALARIHSLYLALDPGWTMTETAVSVSMSLAIVSQYLRVAGHLDDERISASSNWREAYNVLLRREAREQGNALEELLEVPVVGSEAPIPEPSEAVLSATESSRQAVLASPTPAPDPDPVKHLSFLDWAPTYFGPKFNLIHCDFPYGNEAVGAQMRGSEGASFYQNEFEIYLDLLTCLCENIPRLMSLSGHLLFWCSSEILSSESEYARRTRQIFREQAQPLSFHRFPLIWVKSDNAGIASDPRHGPRHVYEVCLLASRGSRQIVKIVSDAYSAPSDRKLHPSTKPEPMLRHFMSMLVDQTTSVLDPTAGSGAALRAADSLGASRLLGLEIDGEHVRTANQAFRNARLLRSASRGEDLL